ncbi:MAG TPA: C1 family peptidase [Paludibacteraceae bacterium]|nr:C1 family peptidase [Paludibacteraceae bacterium]HPT42859.1 C1 family peptidase [Paludibacteraceae bacterium]
MKRLLIYSLMLCMTASLAAQNYNDTTFNFTVVKENKITPVKNQANSSTCWSFSGLAFFESELLRLGKPAVDLSEMFVVHHSYSDKADKYLRMNGTSNFAPGGSFYDDVYVWKTYGMIPDSVMNGLNYGETKHNHGELDALTGAFMTTMVKNPNKKISSAWKPAFEGILNAYLGKLPTEFTVNGKKYTPVSYANSLGLNMDDYVSITSFTHHPFYTKFAIEIPDNWRWAESYNIPLDEFDRIFDYAVENGYTVAWGSDVSEKGFTRNGIGLLPETKAENLNGTDQAKWVGKQKDMKYDIKGPMIEEKVTQESRQKGFDNYQTTDDHGMLIYGIAKDQNGTPYYMVKNSWGTDNKYKGTWYVSKPFVMSKTINILVHKDAVPKDIRKKLGI